MAKAAAPRKRRERRYEADQMAVAYTRTRLGFSQRELAAKVGVHPSLIAQLETGRCSVSDAVLERMAAELGVPVALLIRKKAS